MACDRPAGRRLLQAAHQQGLTTVYWNFDWNYFVEKSFCSWYTKKIRKLLNFSQFGCLFWRPCCAKMSQHFGVASSQNCKTVYSTIFRAVTKIPQLALFQLLHECSRRNFSAQNFCESDWCVACRTICCNKKTCVQLDRWCAKTLTKCNNLVTLDSKDSFSSSSTVYVNFTHNPQTDNFLSYNPSLKVTIRTKQTQHHTEVNIWMTPSLRSVITKRYSNWFFKAGTLCQKATLRNYGVRSK